MTRLLCDVKATKPVPEREPPAGIGTCADPCVGEEQLIRAIAEAAAGRDAAQALQVKALAQASYWVALQRKTTYESFDTAAFLDVFRAAYPNGGPEGAQAEALLRFYQLVGRAGAQGAVDRGSRCSSRKGSRSRS